MFLDLSQIKINKSHDPDLKTEIKFFTLLYFSSNTKCKFYDVYKKCLMLTNAAFV